MVEHLLDQPGSAYDPVLFEFVGDVKNDQRVEIERMHALLVTLYEDPRANLKPGLTDAGTAIKNLRLISSLPNRLALLTRTIQMDFPKPNRLTRRKKKMWVTIQRRSQRGETKTHRKRLT